MRETKRVVLTNGCFDIIHAGHIDCLGFAKSLGDELWVAVNDDRSVYLLKGPGRPINKLTDRLRVVRALRMVDRAESFHGPRLTDFIYQVRPNIYVKGGDYTLEKLDKEERVALEDIGAKICFAPYKMGLSTTSMIEKAKVWV